MKHFATSNISLSQFLVGSKASKICQTLKAYFKSIWSKDKQDLRLWILGSMHGFLTRQRTVVSKRNNFQHSYFLLPTGRSFSSETQLLVINLKAIQHTFSFELVFRLKADLFKSHNNPTSTFQSYEIKLPSQLLF